MKKPVKRVGRFQLSAKDRKSIAEAFKRTDEKLINVRPAISGSGMKRTKKQRIRDGFEKEAQGLQIDPRLIQYGLPALLGATLGGVTGGGRAGLLGALLGAGAGHYAFNPQQQAQAKQYITNLLGGGASTGAGSSAEPLVSSPTSTVPAGGVVPKEAINEVLDSRAKQYIMQGVDVDAAYKAAADEISRSIEQANLFAGDVKNQYTPDQMLDATLKTLKRTDRTKLMDLWQQAQLGGMKEGYDPTAGLVAGTPAWALMGLLSGTQKLGKGNILGGGVDLGLSGSTGLDLAKRTRDARAASLVAGGRGMGTLRALLGSQAPAPTRFLMQKIPGLSKLVGSGWYGPKMISGTGPSTFARTLPGEIMKWQTVIDLGRILGTAASAPVDPNLPWYSRLGERVRRGGEIFGRANLADIYGPKSQHGTIGKLWKTFGSMATAPISATVAKGDKDRAVGALRKNMAAQGLFTKNPLTGTYEQDDYQSERLRQKLRRLENQSAFDISRGAPMWSWWRRKLGLS